MSGPRYLLDTNAVISMLNEPGGAVAGKLRTLAPAEVALSSVVMHELYFGAFKSQRVERNVALVDQLGLDVLAWDRGGCAGCWRGPGPVGAARSAHRPV